MMFVLRIFLTKYQNSEIVKLMPIEKECRMYVKLIYQIGAVFDTFVGGDLNHWWIRYYWRKSAVILKIKIWRVISTTNFPVSIPQQSFNFPQ